MCRAMYRKEEKRERERGKSVFLLGLNQFMGRRLVFRPSDAAAFSPREGETRYILELHWNYAFFDLLRAHVCVRVYGKLAGSSSSGQRSILT